MAAVSTAALLCGRPALADGELHIYNWGDYTNPKLIEKFEKQYNVKVTLDDYDSNETMLAKVRAGNTGYDIVVPSDYTVKIMIDEGMLEKTEPEPDAELQERRSAVRRHLLGQGPPLHGAVAVRHHRPSTSTPPSTRATSTRSPSCSIRRTS